jgi:segregation and condensation protein A
LSATLELTKEGQLQIQQLGTFETLYMRKRPAFMESRDLVRDRGGEGKGAS